MRWVGLLLIPAFCMPADELPKEVIALARIRDGVRHALDRLPDCTCIETLDRYMQPPGKQMRPMDRVVLQTLFSGDQELFAAAADTNWNADPASFIGSGIIGNGLFALNLKTVFLNNVALVRYHPEERVGQEEAAGQHEERYDYTISRQLSGYKIHHDRASGIAGMQGSFWADAETHELRRLDFHAADMPAELMYADVYTSIDYGHVRIGERDVLLPQTAVLQTSDVDGEFKRNVIEFTHCQGFQTESTLSFGDAPPVSHGPTLTLTKRESTLPAGLRLTIALNTPVNDRTAVGTLIGGRTVGNVPQKGKVIVPDGTVVRGRVRRLEHYPDHGDGLIGGYYAIGLEFMRVEAAGATLRFYAEMQEIDRADGMQMTAFGGERIDSSETKVGRATIGWVKTTHDSITTHDVPGVGTFFVRREHFSLPVGFKTVWRTAPFGGQ